MYCDISMIESGALFEPTEGLWRRGKIRGGGRS